MAACYLDSGGRRGVLRHGRAARARTSCLPETHAEGFSGRIGDRITSVTYGTRRGRRTVVERQSPAVRGQTRGTSSGGRQFRLRRGRQRRTVVDISRLRVVRHIINHHFRHVNIMREKIINFFEVITTFFIRVCVILFV